MVIDRCRGQCFVGDIVGICKMGCLVVSHAQFFVGVEGEAGWRRYIKGGR